MAAKRLLLLAACIAIAAPAPARAQSATPSDGSVLPFPPTPSASTAGPTLQESRHVRRVEPGHPPADAPNILIVLLDDVGFGLPSTFDYFDRSPFAFDGRIDQVEITLQ